VKGSKVELASCNRFRFTHLYPQSYSFAVPSGMGGKGGSRGRREKKNNNNKRVLDNDLQQSAPVHERIH